MYIYYCWITALLPNYQDKIIAALVKKGYMVGPAAKDGQVAISSEKSPSTLFALSLYKAEEITVNQIYEDVVNILQEMKAHYYSVVISHSYESTWGGSNFQLPLKQGVVEKAPPSPPTTPGGKKNVN